MMHRTMKRATLSTLLLVPLLAAAPAAAQPAARPGAVADAGASGDDADALFKKGMAALTAGNTQQAYALDLAAWKLKQTYDIAGNLAQVELMLGKKRDAAEHIAFALAHFPPTVTSDRRDGLKKVLDGLRHELGVLRIQVSAPDAKVAVDGTPVGAAPIAGEVFVDPGAHVVEATLAGYNPAQAQVDAPKGSAQDVTLTLVRAPDTPPVPPGGGTSTAGGPSKPVIITGAVLGGVGVLLGAVFAGVSDAKASDVAAKHDAIVQMGAGAACGATPSAACQALQGAKQDQVRLANASVGSFIAGGAVGAATVIYAVAAPRAVQKSGTRVVPLVAAGGGGVVLLGEW
jgi:PEGA domain